MFALSLSTSWYDRYGDIISSACLRNRVALVQLLRKDETTFAVHTAVVGRVVVSIRPGFANQPSE